MTATYQIEQALFAKSIVFFTTMYDVDFPPCYNMGKTHGLYYSTIKALIALVGRLSLNVGWENGPERGLKKIVSFNLYLFL